MHSIIINLLKKPPPPREDNVGVSGPATTSCLKRFSNFVQCHIFAHSPPDQGTNDKHPVNTALDLCKNISLAVWFGRNGNSYTFSMQSEIRMSTCSSQYRDAGRVKNKEIGPTVNAACQENLSACHRFASSALGFITSVRNIFIYI
jgi:hypothetical protein